jgi:hypothetical protein
VNKHFVQKPVIHIDAESATHEMNSLFQFAENIAAENASKAKEAPENPFVSHSSGKGLTPLEPLLKKGLQPLQPL